MLDRRRAYTEREISRLLAAWPHHLGGRTGLDPSTIRRAMVDDGLLLRDRAGHEYRVSADILQGECAPEVLDIDPEECLRVERERRYVAKRKRGEEEA